jgi:hypothetical protein
LIARHRAWEVETFAGGTLRAGVFFGFGVDAVIADSREVDRLFAQLIEARHALAAVINNQARVVVGPDGDPLRGRSPLAASSDRLQRKLAEHAPKREQVSD